MNTDTEQITVDNLKITIALSDTNASQVSVKAGLSINSLGKYLRGETSISFANLTAVCKVLGVPIGLISSPQRITRERIQLFEVMQAANDEDVANMLNTWTSKK